MVYERNLQKLLVLSLWINETLTNRENNNNQLIITKNQFNNLTHFLIIVY
jgi:hypothetical protein